jgi:predicted transcriptional regulator
MEVHFTDVQQARLRELSAKTGRGTDELVQEAVDRMLSYNQWFKEQVNVGLEQIARGKFIDEEEMDARVERMLRS